MKLCIFDLDGTLAKSKQPVQPNIVQFLVTLAERFNIAILSGCHIKQMRSQIVNHLPEEMYNKLYLMPSCGGQLSVWAKDHFTKVYNNDLSQLEETAITRSWGDAVRLLNITTPQETYGPIKEVRGSQITFSMCGQDAPLSIKELWDPDGAKRTQMASLMRKILGHSFNVSLGGTTSLDVTKLGIDKEYGINQLLTHLKLDVKDALFVGDALFEGGNDYPATQTGVHCIHTTGPDDTVRLVNKYLEETDEGSI